LIGSREITMTMTVLFASADADRVEQSTSKRSLWQLFLTRYSEGRMRKAEREIAEYLARHGRELPRDPWR
jgi:hypothetical protein